jgi:FtsP/CotA-like multicopper oxidase with cupredoxin domain
MSDAESVVQPRPSADAAGGAAALVRVAAEPDARPPAADGPSPGGRVQTRRWLLGVGAGVGGSLLLAGAGRHGARGAEGTPGAADLAPHEGHGGDPDGEDRWLIPGPAPWRSEDLREPEVRRAVDGVLDTALDVRYAWLDIGGYKLHMRTYEGASPGPTLRLRPGDVLRIALANNLPPNRSEAPAFQDLPQRINTTNLHFHGGHVSPDGISDNVFRAMEPGNRYEIEIALPADHSSGTYWYHPHHHGGADLQIASGMVGALIVEGDFADVPEIAAATERVLAVTQVVFDEWRTVEGFETVFPEGATRFFAVNGQREPIVRMRPGEVQRWRLLHAGYQDDILLDLEGHALLPIARDGIELPRIDRAANRPGDPRGIDPAHPDAVLFAPGQRVDVLVRAGDPGEYLLHALAYDQGYPAPTGVVARVVVEGEPLPMALPAALPPVPFAPIEDDELTGARELRLSRHVPESDAAGHWREFAFTVDGKLFDHARVDQTVDLGAVEEWTVVNEDPHNDHVFHIHVNPFQVTRVNGEPLAEPLWLDTAIVPNGGGSITFRTRFLDFAGRYVLHCHMMNHEELGMMQVVEVVDRR